MYLLILPQSLLQVENVLVETALKVTPVTMVGYSFALLMALFFLYDYRKLSKDQAVIIQQLNDKVHERQDLYSNKLIEISKDQIALMQLIHERLEKQEDIPVVLKQVHSVLIELKK